MYLVRLMESSASELGLKYYANWIHGPSSHVSFIWMQSLSRTLKPLKRNQMYYQSTWSKISFIALYSFFLHLWFNIFWISSRATDMCLWKAWMYKLVTLCSHDHFQFEFHLTTQIYLFNWPQKFSRETCFQKKSKNSFQPIFKSECYCEWVLVSFYTDKLYTRETWSREWRQTMGTNVCKFVNFQRVK